MDDIVSFQIPREEFDLLPSILRVLAFTDGTVTKTIEAYFNINLEVKRLQTKEPSQRSVILHEKGHPNHPWVAAESQLHLDNLPFNINYDLTNSHMPIGSVLNRYKLSTFRQIRIIKIVEDEEKAKHFNTKQFLFREYDIIHEDKIAIIIDEYFPIRQFKNTFRWEA